MDAMKTQGVRDNMQDAQIARLKEQKRILRHALIQTNGRADEAKGEDGAINDYEVGKEERK
jgi:hypothetical protein